MASENVGLFLPTTQIFDIQINDDGQIDQEGLKQLLIRLTQIVNDISIATNLKDTGYYALTEFVNGQVFFPNPALAVTVTPVFRQVFRKVIDFGALPNAGTKSVAHGIAPTATFSFTRIYATASDTTGLTYIPIPYVSVAALINNVEINVDAVNVNITTGINRTNYNICYVILEYIKQ